MENDSAERQFYVDKMKLYIDNAKSFIQISSAALILPVVVVDRILPKSANGVNVKPSLIVSWAFFLIAIGAGLLYQYLAVKCIENDYLKQPHKNPFIKEPGKWAYGPMIVCFYVGALTLVYYCSTIL